MDLGVWDAFSDAGDQLVSRLRHQPSDHRPERRAYVFGQILVGVGHPVYRAGGVQRAVKRTAVGVFDDAAGLL